MAAVELIFPWSTTEEFAERVRTHNLPAPLLDVPNAGGALFRAVTPCLMGALLPMVRDFDAREHRQRESGELLRCAIYFTDDPDVYASCTLVGGEHYVFLSLDLVESLVRVCAALENVLAHRNEPAPDLEVLTGEPSLDAVMTNGTPLTESERASLAERVRAWPIPGFGVAHDTPGIAEMTVLHDLVRIIVAHEFAHCACGHVEFFSAEFGATELPEFAAVRHELAMHEQLGVPRTHVLQAVEGHADSWALGFLALQVLVGYDPAGRMFETQVNLVDRLVLFNLAAAIFTIQWTLAEQRSNPGATFWIGDSPQGGDEGADVIRSKGAPFIVVRSSHPPAVLRYYLSLYEVRVAGLAEYGERLEGYVTRSTMHFIGQIAGAVSRYFYSLVYYTPVIAKTPNMKRLEAYSYYLEDLSVRMAPYIQEFLPTVTPRRSSEPT